MKKLYILLCLSLIAALGQRGYTQTYCDDFDPATFQHTTSVWDWRDNTLANWQAYYKVKPGNTTYIGTQLPFPFRPQSGQDFPNTAHLNVGASGFDHEPADGWELVFKNFGGNSFAASVENPTFVLYNRFKGILRVFIWLTVDQTNVLNEAGIELRFQAPGIGSGLLGLIPTPTPSLQAVDKQGYSATPNSYSNTQGGEWLFADVPMAYDPCTCNYSLSPTGVLQANTSVVRVQGTLGQNSTFTTTDANGQTEAPSTSGYGTTATASSGIEKATKFFKTIGALKDELDKLGAKTSVVPIDSTGSYEIKTTTAVKLPAWIKLLPYVGDVFTVLDALVTGGQKSSASSAQTATPTSVSFSGNMSLEGNVLPMEFYAPGSPHDDPVYFPNPDLPKVPVYDHVLGIFNLLETPVLEWTSYTLSGGPSSYDCISINGAYIMGYEYPVVRQYHLKNPLKFVVNPASELQLVGLDASIVYEIGNNPADLAVPLDDHVWSGDQMMAFYGPVVLKKSPASIGYQAQLEQSGIMIDFWPRSDPANPQSAGVNDMRKLVYSTGFYAATCLQQQSILLAFPASNGELTAYNYQPKFRLKVRAIFKRTDQDATTETEAVVWMASFEVKAEDQATAGGQSYYMTTYTSGNPIGFCPNPKPQYISSYAVSHLTSATSAQLGHFPMGTNGLPLDLTFQNTMVEYSQEALRSITVKDSWVGSTQTFIPPPPDDPEEIIYGPPITLRAGSAINILPGTEMDRTTTLEIALPARFQGCQNLPLPTPVSWAEVNTFCSNPTKYNPNITAYKQFEEPIASLPFTAAPNPFTDEIAFSFSLEQEEQVSLTLLDLAGRTVALLAEGERMDAGTQDLTLPGSGLAPGIYLAVLETSRGRQTLRVVKQ